jgi:cytochrome c5
MKKIFMLLLMASLASTLVFAQAAPASKPGTPAGKQPVNAQSAKPADEGGRKFDANCGRCHSAPEQLSPSVTGTVVRHMRVRASLSAQDEKDILRYLAP